MTMTNNTHAASGAANNCTILPDGSAFAVASFPLPKDHWLYAPREYDVDAEHPKELPSPILTHALRAEVVSAIRYAIRGATMCGKETDFDPDALVQNAVYALCGPYGSAALAAPKHPKKDFSEVDFLLSWFNENDGFSQGTKAPHKWVLQTHAELIRLRAALAAPAPPASIEQEAMQMLWNDQQQEEKEHYRNVARGAERIK